MKFEEQNSSSSSNLSTLRRVVEMCEKQQVPLLSACPANEKQLGQGGHASCYKATLHTPAGSVEVVVKRLLPSRCLPQGLVLEELVSEAVLLARVAGVQGVPRLHGVVLDPPALVTSFEGPSTLNQALTQQRDPSEEAVLSVVVQVCLAAAGLHQRGVAHNDIKTNNVVVREAHGGRLAACLIDLGNSAPLGQAIFPQGSLCWEHHRFLAPELVAGEPGTAASDVFSLGHMMAGLARRLRPHSQVRQLLERLGAMATARCPSQRPSLQDLIASLEGVLGHDSPGCALT